ncbi:MAG: hypothetical protein ABIQ86_01030 [Steroidobacteraceae bacterium]
MSFREKSAWVTLIAIIFVSVLYVLHVPRVFEPTHWAFVAMMMSVASFVVIEVVGWLVLRLRNPAEARTPKDELEKLIELKALRIAAYVYFVGSFAAVFITLHLHHGVGGHVVGASVLLVFIVAEIVNYTARIVYYRRHS